VIRAIDDFLIDRVFQRISDALARWVSCYGIAAFLLAGAILSEFAAAVMPHDVLAALLGIVWVFRLIRVHRMDAAAYSDVLPAERIKDVFWRPAGVALCVLHLMQEILFLCRCHIGFLIKGGRCQRWRPTSWYVAA
jgi:hypothetical protein